MEILFFLIFAVLLGIAYVSYKNISGQEDPPVEDVLLQPEQLEKHAKQLALEHSAAKEEVSPRILLRRLNKNFDVISLVYRAANEYTRKGKELSPASEWLLDNFYKIEEQVKEVRQSLATASHLELRALDKGILRGYPRVYAIALELISHTDGRLDEKLLMGFIKAYQTHKKLLIAEIWSLSLMIRLALIENIRRICERVQKTQEEWEEAEKLLNENKENLKEALNDHLDRGGVLTPPFVEHLLKKLRREGLETGEMTAFIDNLLAENDRSIGAVVEQEHHQQAARKIAIGNSITSLNIVSVLDWNDIFESLCTADEILREDPVQMYQKMDFESRNYYRKQVELISKKLGVSQTSVARKAVECASKKLSGENNPKAEHVGYYLAGPGRRDFFRYLGSDRSGGRFHNHSLYTYLGPVFLITAVIVSGALTYVFRTTGGGDPWVFLFSGLAVLIPASEISILIVNLAISRRIAPGFLPKLEFDKGIPEEYATLVVVPTLLTSPRRVEELLERLEVYYLANREDNLYFAIAGDFKDAERQEMPGDGTIIETAAEGVKRLNRKYPGDRERFFFFHRHRKFCKRQNRWMGWERKRGALIELNAMLRGSGETSYSFVSGNVTALKGIRYVITLDADTNIPMDTAKELIGTIAHPLNRAFYDIDKGIVVDGYGIIQPRIGIDVGSANKTAFTRIFAGQGGIDPYSAAVSDAYQDMFGEGIFTGKGIYDLEAFDLLMKDAFPDDTILSHDLLEGSYMRTALASDVELIDGYPANYYSYIMRLHRWVRGDWQLIRWLMPRVKNRDGKTEDNPLGRLSKWKIFDNMRRSLVPVSLFILIVAGITVLPGTPILWIGIALIIPGFQLIRSLTGFLSHETKTAFTHMLLTLMFLPHQSYMMADAILRTLYRVYVSGENLLEWVTAAETERNSENDLGSYARKMRNALIISFLAILPVWVIKPQNAAVAVFFIVIWGLSPIAAHRTGMVADAVGKVLQPSEDEIGALRRIARKTWAYYEDFADAENNYLPPDNLQVNPPNGIAHRTSPTNIGFLLLSIISARDFGYISTSDMIMRADRTISSIEGMETWKGHLYNWYDTRTLEVLRPFFVSTVDSGNLVGYLIVLKQGLLEYLDRPLAAKELVRGLEDTQALTDSRDRTVSKAIETFSTKDSLSLSEWKELLHTLPGYDYDNNGWSKKLKDTIETFADETKKFFLGNNSVKLIDALAGNGDEVFGYLCEKIRSVETNNSLRQLAEVYGDMAGALENAAGQRREEAGTEDDVDGLKNDVYRVKANVEDTLSQVANLVERIQKIVDDTEFSPLYDRARHLFSIGYNVEEEKLVNSYYDLLASEARLTSYIAIARREVPKKHWLKMGRALAVINRKKGLVSWGGTMFEYFMPLLVMKNYGNTLLDETYAAVLSAQKAYGEKRKVPWGTSESGYYAFDMLLNYQYKAFGVPDFGLKRGLANDMVVSPYSTLLALTINPGDAVENIKMLKNEGLEGNYGFYEAVDYTPSRLPPGEKKGIVQSFMAHHQGMSFIVLNNYFNDNPIQKRFHSDPVIRAAETLLQEKIPARAIITKEYKERIGPLEREEKEDNKVVRIFGVPGAGLPGCHIISNGRFSTLITNGGSGYSKLEDVFLTRWRRDMVTGRYGEFILLRNLNSNHTWSAAYEPLRQQPDGYMAIFAQDKAEFYRTDDNIETHCEISVATEDNAEIRKVTLTNHGKNTVTIELTSYFEVVMADIDSDIAHPAFDNLFVRTELVEQYEALIASRRPREHGRDGVWAVHRVLCEGEMSGHLQYETNRGNFIGRGRDISNPAALTQPLSNTTGIVLDPIMSLRRRVRIEPGSSARVSFVSGVAASREEAVDIARKYGSAPSIARAFELAYTRSQVEASYLNMRASEIKTYQNMIPYVVFNSPSRRKMQSILKQNKKGQQGLWSYGISGDVPILLVAVDKEEDMDLVKDCLRAYEYWRTKGLKVDLVILNEDESNYLQPLQELLNETVLSSPGRHWIDHPGGVFIRNANVMPREDRILFYSAARIVLRGGCGPIDYQVRPPDTDELPKVKSFDRYRMEYASKAAPLELEYFNGYGGFSDDGKKYVIRLKGFNNTPAPWINVISNGRFGFHISESGSGLVWSENSRENKLTPWSNDPVSDTPGEVIYLRDEENGDIWTVTPLPIRGEEAYTIEHGLGYTQFIHDSHGIEQKLTAFVPPEDPVKLSLLRLKNNGNAARKISVTYYIRPVLGVSEEKTQQHLVTEMGQNGSTLLVTNPFNSEFPGRIAFADISCDIAGYTGDREEFIGARGDLKSPEALKREGLLNRVGAGYDPCVVLQSVLEIRAGEEKELTLMFGQEKNTESLYRIVGKYKNPDACSAAMERAIRFWDSVLGTIKVGTPDRSMNLMLNYWLLYQTISCRLWARSAFYQSGGAFGFRDQLQDAMNSANVIPRMAREQILLHCEHQFVEGDVQHWWHPGADDKGVRTRFSDDLLWLPYATADYVQKTGDYSILEEETGFLEGEPLREDEDERYSVPKISKEKGTVYEHCIRAIERSLRFGERGIPLMGSGDWNDGMNTVGNKGRGESIWLGWFLCDTLVRFAPICKHMNDGDRAQRYTETAQRVAAAIEENGWDGGWYRRAYFDDGTPLGSSENTECTIDSIAQSWAVMSGQGSRDRTIEAMKAVEQYLVKRDEGLILLFTPPFDQSKLEPGYIKGYVPGVRENGGQYTHAATWVINAFAMMGEGDKAWSLFNMINPLNHARTPIECASYKVEPYVVAADVYTVNPHQGRGGWTWYTGAAGWMHRVGLEHILGFCKNGTKLFIDPCIPKDWNGFNIEYRYMDTIYHISVLNPYRVSGGVKTIRVDGKPEQRGYIELIDDKARHLVEITLGDG